MNHIFCYTLRLTYPRATFYGLYFCRSRYDAGAFIRFKNQPRPELTRTPLKSNLYDVPIFRHSIRTVNGLGISERKPLPFSRFNDWIRKLGRITGIEMPTSAYPLRRGSGEALDSSSK